MNGDLKKFVGEHSGGHSGEHSGEQSDEQQPSHDSSNKDDAQQRPSVMQWIHGKASDCQRVHLYP